ncbi:MAG: helix-turn-helix domain-containing protein [Porphyromonadaceae bacterium]|nr:helix-turn-helix domain-containing protein [Porphyromonadaceae bacterium]
MLSRNGDELYGMRVASKKHYISTAKVCVKLKLSELTIEDIAERCGFEHDSSFYHTFKKMYGITPAEFRRGRA